MKTKTAKKRAVRRKPAQRAITREKIIQLLGLHAGSSAAGVNVGVADAMGLSAYYACVQAISQDVAKLPLNLYEGEGKTKKRMDSNPLYRLLKYQPNDEMTSFAFRETMTAHALAWGNGFAEIEWTGGRVSGLYPLPPTDVFLKRVDGRLFYIVRIPGQPEVALTPDNILHIHGLGYDGLQGYGLTLIAKDSLGAAIATQKHSGTFYANGAVISGILRHPGVLSDAAYKRLRESWAERHEGAANAHKPAILEQGLEYTPISSSARDSQQIETRQYEVEDVCRWFRVPPHKIGHLLRAAGWSTLEATNQDYLTDCLMAWLVRWEQEIWRKLILRPTQYVEHLFEAMLRPDTTTRYSAYATAVTNGWMNRNEVRLRENLEPQEGLDDFLYPTNLAVVGEEPPEPEPLGIEPEPEPEEDAERFRPILEIQYSKLRKAYLDKSARGKMINGQLEEHRTHAEKQFRAALIAGLGDRAADRLERINGMIVADYMSCLSREAELDEMLRGGLFILKHEVRHASDCN